VRPILAHPAARGNAASSVLRPDAATAPPPSHPSHPADSGQVVGYAFDPIPSAIRRDPRLKPIDHLILAILISFAIWRRDSCWTTIPTIARRVPAIRPGRSGKAVASERTVQRSIDRLKAAGYIRHERVAKPDPDQPDNWTGWRFYFNFAPVQVGPIGPPREVTKVPAPSPHPIAAPGGEVTMESGDSIVTQFRRELGEPDPITLNVAALALEGEGKPTMSTDPVATAELAPAPELTEDQFADQLRELTNPRSRLRVFAYRILEGAGRLPAEFAGLFPATSPRATTLPASTPAPAPIARPVASPVAMTTAPAAPRLARKIPDATQADLRARLGRLALPDATDADADATARAMTTALGPHRDEGITQATFFGMCVQRRRGEIPEFVLFDALDRACNFKRATSRGSVFIARVKELRGQERGRGCPPARPSDGAS
jgi:hypothetical protein